MAVPPEFVKNIFEVNDIPEYVQEEKYCYSEENGFYINENYEEPIETEE